MTYIVQNARGYDRNKGMRVVSLVPSLTETLAECGVNLVARTRFCLHPESIGGLPAVGGTKDLKLEKLVELSPDLLILDREENLPWMKEQAPCAVHVFHGASVEGMPAELLRLAAVLEEGGAASFCVRELRDLAERYRQVALRPRPAWNFAALPGGMGSVAGSLVASASVSASASAKMRIIYVIWKNPWMRVGPGTYIHSVLEHLGAGEFIFESAEVGKYPQFEFGDLVAQNCFFLFSSEPYPFAKHPEKLAELGVEGAVVDGEGYSWFGIRSLRFLEKYKK